MDRDIYCAASIFVSGFHSPSSLTSVMVLGDLQSSVAKELGGHCDLSLRSWSLWVQETHVHGVFTLLPLSLRANSVCTVGPTIMLLVNYLLFMHFCSFFI